MIKLYEENSYIKEFKSKIVNLDEENKLVELEKSAFYGKGGGQPGDTGKLIKELETIMDKISDLKSVVIDTLDLNKALDIVTIDLKDKSSMADYMIIASGTSSRHLQSLSEQVLEKLKDNGIKNSRIEGKESSEWKLVDGIDLIVHIFHPEKRKFYELEKIWSELIPKEKVII